MKKKATTCKSPGIFDVSAQLVVRNADLEAADAPCAASRFAVIVKAPAGDEIR